MDRLCQRQRSISVAVCGVLPLPPGTGNRRSTAVARIADRREVRSLVIVDSSVRARRCDRDSEYPVGACVVSPGHVQDGR